MTLVVLILKRPEYGIAATLALSPLTNLTISTGTEGELKPFQFLLPALAFGSLVYGLLVTRTSADTRPTDWLSASVVFVVAAAVASSLQALDPSASVKKVFIFLTAAALYFTVVHVCKTRRQLTIVAAGAVLGLLVASLQGVVQQVFGQYSDYGFVADGVLVRRVQGSFGHPNQYGGYVAVLTPLAVAFALTRRLPTSFRVLGATAVALALPALVFSYVRGAIAALAVGSLVWLAILRPRAAAAVAVLVAAAALLLAPATLRERFSGESATSGDVALREDLWSAAIDIYAERPALGVGLNNFGIAYSQLPAVLPNASQRRLLHQTEVLVPPHAANLYLNILAEQGLVGIAAFAMFGLSALAAAYRGSRARDPVGRNSSLAVGAGVLVLAAHSMLEVTLQTETALPLFTLLAVVAGFAARDVAERGSEP